jgi:predicted GIY-YIG superfamily endonuclease
MTALYRHYDADGTLLYVGISDVLESRTREHMKHSPWARWAARREVEWLPTLAEATLAEVSAIRAEHPVFNTVHNDEHREARLVRYLVWRQAYSLLRSDLPGRTALPPRPLTMSAGLAPPLARLELNAPAGLTDATAQVVASVEHALALADQLPPGDAYEASSRLTAILLSAQSQAADLRYGVARRTRDANGLSFAQLGRTLGMSKERAQQLCSRRLAPSARVPE